MKWKEFAKKVKPLLKDGETIEKLGFVFKGKKYRIRSQWGSGDNRELVNLWAKKIGSNDDRVYPFFVEQADMLKFFRIERKR